MRHYSLLFLFCALLLFSCRPKLPSHEEQLGNESFNGFQANGEKIYASTSFGKLYMTTDVGKTWKDISAEGEFKWYRKLFFYHNYLFIGTSEGLIRTSDDGTTWSRIGTERMLDATIDDLAANNQYLFAAGVSAGIYRSSDNGNTWAKLDNGLKDTWIYYIDCVGEKLVATSNSCCFISTNNGNSWDTLHTNDISIDTWTEPVIVKNRTYLKTHGDGIFYTENDGEIWTGIPEEITHGTLNELTVDGNYMYLCTDEKMKRSTDNGMTWSVCDNGIDWKDGQRVNTIYTNGDHLWMGTDHGIYLSKDRGDSWKLLTKKPDQIKFRRYGDDRRSMFYFGLFLAWVLVWISPLILLAKVKNGYRTYLINLVTGIIFIVGGMMTYANQPTTGRLDFGNLGRAIILVIIYASWGLVLLIYSAIKRTIEKRNSFHDMESK